MSEAMSKKNCHDAVEIKHAHPIAQYSNFGMQRLNYLNSKFVRFPCKWRCIHF